MPPPPGNRLLDLDPGVGQVSYSFRWDLHDRSGNLTGQVHPRRGAALANDTRSTLFRSCRGFEISQTEAADINPYQTTVRPWLDLADGTSWPLGALAFGTFPRPEGSPGAFVPAQLVDFRFYLTQPLPHSFSVADGGSIASAIDELLNILGENLDNADISDTDARVGGGPINWPPDQSSLQVLESLAQRAGFYPPYYSNQGRLTLRPVEPLQTGLGHVYDRSRGRILPGSLVLDPNMLSAPNVYRVISSGPTSSEVWAEAEIDSSLPNSVFNYRRIVKTIRIQGLADEAACRVAAETHARADGASFSTVEMSSVFDPRHDTFDLVEIDGGVYREISWSGVLTPGGTHSHTLAKELVTDG